MDCTVHEILQARILEWVACPISRGSSQPRDQTQASCIVGRLFTSWATRGAPLVTFGKLFPPPEASVPHVQNGDNIGTSAYLSS